jgi:hypothetical protein
MTIATWEFREGFSLIGKLWILGVIVIDTIFHFSSEMSYETLNGPSSSISKSADCMTFNLVG